MKKLFLISFLTVLLMTQNIAEASRMCPSKIRFVNLTSEKLEAEINGVKAEKPSSKNEVSEYIDVYKNTANIKISGKEINLPLIPNNSYTLAIYNLSEPSFRVFEDDLKQKSMKERSRAKVYLLTEKYGTPDVLIENNEAQDKKTIPYVQPNSASINFDFKAGKFKLQLLDKAAKKLESIEAEFKERTINSIFITDSGIRKIETKISDEPGCTKIEK